MLTFKQPQEILLGAAVWATLLSGAFLLGPDAGLSVLMPHPCSHSGWPPTPLNTHESVTFGSTWFPLSPLAGGPEALLATSTLVPMDTLNSQTGGCSEQMVAGSGWGTGWGTWELPSTLQPPFPLLPTQWTQTYTHTHTHTHTHTYTQKRFSLDPAGFWPWQRTHDISNITNATTMLTFIEYQSSASHWLMKHLAYEGKEIPYQNSLSSVFLTQFKHDYLDQVFLWLMWLLMCLWIISEAYWNFKFLGPNWKMQIQEIRHWTQDSAQGARGFQRSWSGPLERKPVLAQGCPDFGVPMESVKMQSDSGYQRRSLEILHFWLAPRWGWCCRSLEYILSNKNLNGQSPRGWFMQDLAANSPICDPMDYSLPGSSVYGISQARILE